MDTVIMNFILAVRTPPHLDCYMKKKAPVTENIFTKRCKIFAHSYAPCTRNCAWELAHLKVYRPAGPYCVENSLEVDILIFRGGVHGLCIPLS